MMLVLVLFLVNGIPLTIAVDNDQSKRLIGNDPDVLEQRMNQLETKLAQLTAENQKDKLQIQNLESSLNTQRSQIQNVESQLNSQQDSGSTYVIWGRRQCPNNSRTEQVYSGFAGGSYYTHAGAAAEYVCLPPDPDFEKTSAVDGGRMYGAEYEGSNFWGANSVNEDVPCALCRTTIATSTIMISGKNKCYSGWTMEYHGYLAANAHGYAAASQYVCVDSHPEYLNAGVRNDEGKLFYPVRAICGSLPCPPYVNNYPLTCVVCSK